jgi:hypothetical protein
MTLAEVLAASRVFALRGAAVAKFAARFPEVAVTPHIGKLDISDVLAKDMFAPPAIAVAATRFDARDRLSGADDAEAHFTAYVIAENKMIGGKLVKADELALALCEALLVALSDPDFARWRDDAIGPPEDLLAQPLFTIKAVEKGALYYAVTWRQTLYALAARDAWTTGEGEGVP